MRILIAEDETIIRLDLRELLERAGFEVCAEARDGEEAVELARSADPDLARPRRQDAAARRDRGSTPDPRGASDPDRDGHRLRRGGARLARRRSGRVRLPREAVPRERPPAGDRHRPCAARGARRAFAARRQACPRRWPRARRSSAPRGCSWSARGSPSRRRSRGCRKASQISGKPLRVVAEALIATLAP